MDWRSEYDFPSECPECGEGYKEVQKIPEMVRQKVTGHPGMSKEELEKIPEQKVPTDEVAKFMFVHEMGGIEARDAWGRDVVADTIEEACEVDNEGQFDA